MQLYMTLLALLLHWPAPKNLAIRADVGGYMVRHPKSLSMVRLRPRAVTLKHDSGAACGGYAVLLLEC